MGSSSVWLGGDFCTDPAGWTYWCKQALRPASMRSYARSGATWSCTPLTQYSLTDSTAILSDNNVMLNQIGRLVAAYRSGAQVAPDMIVICAGTNDVWFAKRRPDAMTMTPQQAMEQTLDPLMPVDSVPSLLTSVALSIRYSVEWLKFIFPEAKIVLLTPTQITKVTEEKTEQISVLIEEMAALLDVECIRQDLLSPIRRADELKAYHYTKDGVHPTQEAAQLNGERLAEQLRSLSQPD